MNKIYKVLLYQKENGKIPVREFFHSLQPKMRAKAFRDIELLNKYGNRLQEPYVKPLRGKQNKGLYELRIKFANDIARVFYFTYHDNTFVLLHGVIKKSMKVPRREIDKALQYMNDYIRRSEHE